MPVSAITSNFGVVNMEIISAADIEADFDQFMDTAQRGPVAVTRKNRPVGVFFSMDDIQDTIWAKELGKPAMRVILQLRKALLA